MTGGAVDSAGRGVSGSRLVRRGSDGTGQRGRVARKESQPAR